MKETILSLEFPISISQIFIRRHIRGSDFEEAADLWLIGSFCMVSDSHWVTPTSHYIVVTGKTRFFERRTTVIWKSEQSKSYGYVLSKIDTDMHWNRSFRDICRPRHPFHHYSVKWNWIIKIIKYRYNLQFVKILKSTWRTT